MFLRQVGASGEYTFDVIYSGFQKLMRRNDVKTCLELAKEFKEYPNALKGRLMYNVAEDICDLDLLIAIYNTEADVKKLINFVPPCCNHIKCREGLWAFRIACEKDLNFDELNDNDDLITAMCKLKTKIKANKTDDIIAYYELKYNCNILGKMFKYMKDNRTFLYSLIVYDKLQYTHEKFEVKALDIDIDKIDKITLPKFVYDRHTSIGKRNPETSDYSFFIDNIVLIPKFGTEESPIEKEAKKLYKESDKSSSDFLKPFTDEELQKYYPKPVDILKCHRYLQTQLITGRNKPKVYYYDIKDDKSYSKVIKGPVNYFDYLRNKYSDLLKKDVGLKSQHLKYAHGYIIANNFIKINPKEYVRKTSKLETDVKIFNGKTYGCNKDTIDKLTEPEKLEWLKCLVFRKIIGTNDSCFRNFLAVNGHVITIDDAIIGDYATEYMFKTKLNPKVAEKFNKALDNNFDEIKKWLLSCRAIIKNSSYLSDNMKQPMLTCLENFMVRKSWKF